MSFANNIKKLRIERGLTQKQTAAALGITTRTWQNYELGNCMPRAEKTVRRISDFFNVPISELLSIEDYYILDASERGGTKAQRELKVLLSELTALYSGGKLSENDKDLVINALNEIYWDSKEKSNEKHSPKKSKASAKKSKASAKKSKHKTKRGSSEV